MNSNIHPTAIIAEGAKIHESVVIGPYCVIDEGVELKENNVLHSHVVMQGIVEVGTGNEFFPFCVIGSAPQDLTYKNEPSKVIIGSDNVFREYVSIHRGTPKENMLTEVKDKNLLMAQVHLGHDVVMGSHCIIANSCKFGGHCKIGDYVFMGGGCSIQQFVHIGKGAYIGGETAMDRDVPPFFKAYGNRVELKGINAIGIKRRGYERSDLSALMKFFKDAEASQCSLKGYIDKNNIEEIYKSGLVNEIKSFVFDSKAGVSPFNL